MSKKYKMIKARKYLVILSSFFMKAYSINLILLGTYSEPLIIIIIIKLNTSFAGTASTPPTFPSPRHLQILSYSLSTNKTYAFLFSGPDASHATPQVCGARSVLCAVSHERTNVSYTYHCKSRTLRLMCVCTCDVYTWRVIPG